MANWRTKINLAKCLDENDEETPEAILECAKSIKQEVDQNPYARRALVNLPFLLVQKTEMAVQAGFDYETICDVFNGALSHIYDAADRELIWTNG